MLIAGIQRLVVPGAYVPSWYKVQFADVLPLGLRSSHQRTPELGQLEYRAIGTLPLNLKMVMLMMLILKIIIRIDSSLLLIQRG